MNHLFARLMHVAASVNQYIEWAAKQPGPPGFLFDGRRQKLANGPFALAIGSFFVFSILGDMRILPQWLAWLGMGVSVMLIYLAGYVMLEITTRAFEHEKRVKESQG